MDQHRKQRQQMLEEGVHGTLGTPKSVKARSSREAIQRGSHVPAKT